MKFTLQRVYIDKQGYVMNTHYYGLSSERLYWYCSEDGTHEDYIRAYNREHAKRIVRDKYPGARFYN